MITPLCLQNGEGGILLWVAFSEHGSPKWAVLRRRQNSSCYLKVVEDDMLLFADDKMPITWIFSHTIYRYIPVQLSEAGFRQMEFEKCCSYPVYQILIHFIICRDGLHTSITLPTTKSIWSRSKLMCVLWVGKGPENSPWYSDPVRAHPRCGSKWVLGGWKHY